MARSAAAGQDPCEDPSRLRRPVRVHPFPSGNIAYALRRGVKFSYGRPFGAKDVVFTCRTVLDAKTNNASKSELDAIADVTARGDDAVVFTLKYPYVPVAERTVLPSAPEHVAGAQDVKSGEFTTKPVGTDRTCSRPGPRARS